MSSKVALLVGTHKGALIYSSDAKRETWSVDGPHFSGMDVHHLIMDARGSRRLHACVNNMWWGAVTRYSDDLGRTWQEPKTPIAFREGDELKLEKTWCVRPGSDKCSTLYAGVAPAALFKSDDHGETWAEVTALTQHATREQWQPGMGGMMVHSICAQDDVNDKIHVGISAAGTFSTDDGGESWEPRNKGVLADFMPDKYPEVGQCVHHLTAHAAKPSVLYQQNHCGVYRSDDGGKAWTDLCDGLPSRFGFPMQIHTHDPDTVYVIPQVSGDKRFPVDGELAVYRSRDRGASWDKLTRGLPGKDAYFSIYREAMCADPCDPCGIYFGTSTGQLFYSRDEGDSWERLADSLAPIYSLSACSLL